MTATDRLARAAERAAENPFYLANVFLGDGHDDVIEWLGLADREQFAKLALCRRPATRADVETIAARFTIDADALAAIVGLKETAMHTSTIAVTRHTNAASTSYLRERHHVDGVLVADHVLDDDGRPEGTIEDALFAPRPGPRPGIGPAEQRI